jgi:hypothetical protein
MLVLVLGLGAFVWFYERKLPSSEEREENAKKVLTVEKDDVRALTLQTDAGTVHLQRVDPPGAKKKDEKDKKDDKDKKGDEAEPLVESEWRITQPFTARAELMAVDRLLDELTNLDKTRTLENAAPADVGLDKPRATVRLATDKGEKVLRIGAEIPTGTSLIVGVEGSKNAYVVADAFFADVHKAPGDWRDHQVFHVQRDAVQGITLTSPAGKVVLASAGDAGDAGDGRFKLTAPVADRADRERVDNLFADLSGLTAERFVDQPGSLATLGLAPARAVVEVAVRGGQPVRVELGAPAAEAAPPPNPETPSAGEVVYARIGTQVFTARTRLAETAAAPAAEWRSPALTSFDVYQVGAMTVKDAQGSLTLERAGTDWKRGKETISYVPVSDLLFTITGARADRLLDAAEAKGLAPLDQPALTVTLTPDQGTPETLTFYPEVAQGVPARASGRDVVLLLPKGKLGEIQKNLAEVRQAKALPPAKPEKK